MLSAVLDSATLVSALLTPGGVTDGIIRQTRNGAFTCCLSDEILGETQRVLMEAPRLRERYVYSDEDVQTFILSLREAAVLIGNLPPLTGIVRDPNDDMVIACASAASADYIVTRDKDLLSLRTYDSTTIVTPEIFMETLRS